MLIGISGPAGVGKSTAAEYLVSNYGYERRRFAGPLKDMMKALGLTEEQVDGAEKGTPLDLLGGKTPRQAMQWLGTEWGRELVVDDLWIRAWRKSLPKTGKVVVDDVRFENEVAELRTRGGTIIYLSGRGGIVGSHKSEGFVPQDAIKIDNSGHRSQLYGEIDRVLWSINKMDSVGT